MLQAADRVSDLIRLREGYQIRTRVACFVSALEARRLILAASIYEMQLIPSTKLVRNQSFVTGRTQD